MASNNSKYSQEVREETAKFIIESGKSATSVGEEMGIDKNKIISSMSKPGCPYDNSCVESFFCNIKKGMYLQKKLCYN
ncbi:hypothetical protein HMPREF0977_02198 [Clostridium sp. 1_1_41A1FAA]|nr:hypothetical protein HMPREF0977_02198 [Clostridium sp. 1_1_41A1FAA]